MTGLPHSSSEPQRPLNRAERRRQRRTKVVTGAGLALTTSLVGVFPGSRYARAYPAVTAITDNANCEVSTWDELRAALTQYNARATALDDANEFACSTVTLIGDIDDQGADATTGVLPIVSPDDDTFTIDGNGNSLSFSGTFGSGLSFYVGTAEIEATSGVTITDLEISGTPFDDRPSVYGAVIAPGGVVTIENSWIHHNQSADASALYMISVSTDWDVDIIGSEFSHNEHGAVYLEGGVTTLTVSESYFHHNDNPRLDGGAGGAITVYGAISVVDSTFAYNSSDSIAGAIHAVHNSTVDPVSISNSTFLDNTGFLAGSLYVYVPDLNYVGPSTTDVQPAVGYTGQVIIDHSTFTGGAGSLGATVGADEFQIYSPIVDSTVTITNSVMWGSGVVGYDITLYAGYESTSINTVVEYTAIQTAYSNQGTFDLDYSGTNITDPAAFDPSADLTFGDHGGAILPSFQFTSSGLATGTPHIPTLLPGDTSALVDAAGLLAGPATDQRGVSRPQGDRADIGSVEVEVGGEDVTVTVTPPASQTISYRDSADLTPTYDGFADGDTWETEPTCAVYDDLDNEVSAPYPVGTYTIKCEGGTLPAGYVADYTATGTLVVEKAVATLNYTGTSGSTANASINLSATISDPNCSTDGIVFTVNGVVAPAGSYPVSAGNLYEIEVSYSDPNCEASSVYAVVLATSTTDASSGGGYYNVSGAGKINFGYTVQVNKSKNGSTQVSGQILWNSQNGKFRFKGVITGFVKTTTDCAPGAICGRIIGTGTLRVRDEFGEWIVVASGMAFKASVTDAGTASVCTGGRKSTCSTVNKPDFFGIDILGSNLTGEQTAPAGGWPTAVQLSGGNILIK